MKKWAEWLLVAGALCMGMAGCGSEEKNTSNADAEQKSETASETREEGQAYFKDVDEFVCVSKDCAKKFNNKFGFNEKTKVCYNIVPVKEIENKAKEKPEVYLNKDKFNIVSIGRLTNQKGFDILIDAVEPIIKENKNCELYIIGMGEDYEALSNRIEKLGLKDNVHLLGYVKNPYSILIQADVYVCSSRHESFSLTVAESLILGIPVISTRCTGPIELLENGKYGMLIGHESSDIQNAIEELIMDKEKLENYRKMVSLRKSFFEVEKNIKEWETVLDR